MQCVQAIHAASEAIHHFYHSVNHLHTVVLEVDNERKLVKAMRHLDDCGVRYRHFIDPDLNNEITALASEPIWSKEWRKVFKNFKLLKFNGQLIMPEPADNSREICPLEEEDM